MTTREKFSRLDAVVAEIGITQEELQEWFNPSPFPIVYKKGNNFEVLPRFIHERRNEVWGYEIMPNIILAKKCGADGNVEDTNWKEVQRFAEKCTLEGKRGYLPSLKFLRQNWTSELPDRIKAMDKFLYDKGVDAEERYYGRIWCIETDCYNGGFYFPLDKLPGWYSKVSPSKDDRIAVAFKP